MRNSYSIFPQIPFNLIKTIFSMTLHFHIPFIMEFIICFDILTLCTVLT